MDRCPSCGEPLEAGIGACPRCGWVPLGQPRAPAASPAPTPSTAPMPSPSPAPPPLGAAHAPSMGVAVRMDGALLTFTPAPGEAGGLAGPDPRSDPAPLLKVLAYVMLLFAANALLYGYVGLQALHYTELVEVPGPHNSTVGELREGGIDPLSVLAIVYALVILAAAPAVAYGLLRRRRWAWSGAIVASAVSMGAFPLGTLLGPAAVYLLTRPVLRSALDAPMAGWTGPPPYGAPPEG